MRTRCGLLAPYLCGLLVALVILWGNHRRSLTLGGPELVPAAGAAMETEGGRDGDIDRMSPRRAHIDPVCKMEVGEHIASRIGGGSWYFCTEQCRARFNEDPARYLAETCLVCRSERRLTPVDAGTGFPASWQGQTYRFCTATHRDAFRDDPVAYFMHSMWGIPGWLYYTSIALILVLSFGVLEWNAFRRERRERGRPSTVVPVRVDLLRSPRALRVLASPLLRFLLRALFVTAFVLIIGAGLFGNQLPSKNIAPLLTWTIWWGGLIWLVAYAGKAWCYVCPWDAIAEWAESARVWGRRHVRLGLGLPWPRFMRNIWPATILFIGLTWLELGFGVTMKPRATAWLGLAIFGLAFVSIFLFDRKSFCRYGCLVGRVSGLYALFAPIELRARDSSVCRRCRTHACYTGSEHGEGCPTFEHPARMDQNTYCILCMECLKTCESQNIALRLRPWGEDLLTHHRPRADEAYLALVMLALTGFHGLTMTAAWRDVVGWIGDLTGWGEIVSFSIGMAAIMVAPVLLYAGLVAVSHRLAGVAIGYREYFIRYAYALLPIALFYHLAHNSEHLLMEGQKVIALCSDPFGYEWNLLGTAGWSLQPLVNLPTLWILQVIFITIGHVFSLWTARRAAGTLFPDARSAFRSQLPMLIAMILFSLMSLWLLKQPMEMRSSAM